MQERDQESLEQAQGVPKEYLTVRNRADHSVRTVRSAVTDHADRSAKVQTVREEASEKAPKEGHSVTESHSAEKEEVSEMTVRSATGRAVHSVRDLTDHADRSVKVQTVQEEASEKALKEGHSVTGSHSVEKGEEADSEILPRRA
jgi:hypothetical protein